MIFAKYFKYYTIILRGAVYEHLSIFNKTADFSENLYYRH